ncbi:Metalloprotease [Desarmillaria tabescens]|uniref:Neutral protease 2 n=1 Tax=Armillaria tabescens TaxID=1929756 RepID=A0AA39JEV3_ARMTA|nr:Metalloprotease [Desarmillaria tabescens]KAK0441457.1 Metalloprotease [Desarmillaria tabescens]
MLIALITLCLALSAFASPYKRDGGLTVSLSGPAMNVTSVDDLKFTATVANTGSESLKILKYGTILDDILPTRSFTITKDGETVPFTGIKLTVSLQNIDDSAFAVISPGESVAVEHELSTLFDFASAGPGTFTFTPVTTFQMVGAEAGFINAVSLDKVSVTSSSVEVHVSGDLAKRDLPVLDARAVDICTSTSQRSFIDASYTEAKSLASIASSYIATNGANSLYTAYYGATSTSTIRGVFNNVASESSSSRTLSCTDTFRACSSGVIAYTVISTTNVYFCSLFFSEVPSANLCRGTSVASRNVRGGTTLHELTHATSGTDDVIYGCANDQALSDANQRRNADNYNCFSTQVYQNTQC